MSEATELGRSVPAALWTLARAAYAGAGRAYHGPDHLDEVLERFAEVARGPGWQRPREALVALLFHDAIYVAGAHDNEERSAQLAEAQLALHDPAGVIDRARVRELILLTARHGSLGEASLDPDAALFLDCDVAILGAEPDRFDTYDQGVAREYAAMDPELFAAGRRAFLERLLAARQIFHSPHFRAALEGRARANLRRRLDH